MPGSGFLRGGALCGGHLGHVAIAHVQIGDHVHPVLGLAQTGKAHRRARRETLRVLKEVIEVLGRPDLDDLFKRPRISVPLGGIHRAPDDTIKIRAGAVHTFLELVAGLALVEHAFALAGIGRSVTFGKAGAFLGLGRVSLVAACLDHIAGLVVLAVAATGVIDQLGRPTAQQKDQKRAAQGANDLRECHRIEHEPVSR